MSDSDTRPDDDVFDVERIRRLVELMEGHDLREIDLRQNEQRIRLCRGREVAAVPPMAMPSAAVPAAPHVASPGQAPVAAEHSAPASHAKEEHMVLVTSPMVGTFYASANPNSDPYVKVGDMVEPETTVCVVEAMKVFNEIPAETRGKVVAVLVEDQEPVDHGRPLFKVDTSVS
ncbi:MAG: acetyl-CoA carboxylase biotin carboxyl carrier protein [Planctomycetota bacterium]